MHLKTLYQFSTKFTWFLNLYTPIQKLAGMHMYTVQSERRICSVGTNRTCLFPYCAMYVHDSCYCIEPNCR
jgi:hypothetical protein